MRNYKIIENEEILRDFISWLPDLQPHETFYVQLFARKKYDKDTPNATLRRFVCSKFQLLSRIRQLECPIGSYLGHNDESVSQNSLATYISINPRNLKTATTAAIHCLVDSITNERFNPHGIAMTAIHNSKSRRFITFDIDEVDNLEKALEIVNKCATTIKTRGGYHLIINVDDRDKFANHLWYNELAKLSDVVGDAMSPIPGTLQGNQLVTYEKY